MRPHQAWTMLTDDCVRMNMPNSRLKRLALRISAGLLVASLAKLGLAASLPPYDGTWSVSAVTEQGGCDDSFKYLIHIKDSTLGSGGDAGIVISGKVTQHGLLTVAIGHGYSSATGSGQLSARDGRGKWKAAACSGYWTAAREP